MWLLFFIGVPAIELWLLFVIGDQIGFWSTIAIILATGIVGASLVKFEGLRVLSELRKKLMLGEIPTGSILEGAMLLVAGAFLLTPGVLTDLTGFLLAIPPSRRWLRGKIQPSLRQRFQVRSPHTAPSDVVDAESSVVDSEK